MQLQANSRCAVQKMFIFCRNGHMMTHRDKKPHECKYCDKSYCDHRSLKRHYENYHPNSERAQSVTASAASHKTDTEILRTSKPEGRFTPERDEGRPSPLSSKQDVPQAGFGRKRNSDSMCSNSSDDVGRRPDSHSPHVTFDKPQTAINMLKQVIDSHEHKEKPPMDGYPRTNYYPYPEGYNPQQWTFNPQQWFAHQAQMMKLFNQQPPILVQHGPVPPMNPYCPTDPPQLVPNYAPVGQHPTSDGTQEDNSRKKGDDSGYKRNKDFVVPTDPTSVAIANAKDEQSESTGPRQVHFKDGGLSHMVQWKTVSFAVDIFWFIKIYATQALMHLSKSCSNRESHADITMTFDILRNFFSIVRAQETQKSEIIKKTTFFNLKTLSVKESRKY